MGNSTDSYWTSRDLAQAAALKQAADRAYSAAGVSADKIDVAEVSARFAHEELLYGEALGFWTRNELPALLADSNPLRKHTKVNPSGGPLAGNPVTVAGLARAAEAYVQLSGTAGDRQVPNAQLALAHGAGGICGQNQAVVILQKGDA
jgi:acetyl-CoA acetyltransferase